MQACKILHEGEPRYSSNISCILATQTSVDGSSNKNLKECQQTAWRSCHKFECRTFVEYRSLNPSMRALYRILNRHKHKLLSLGEWETLTSLQSHRTDHMSSTNMTIIIHSCMAAKENTGTDLNLHAIIELY